MKKRVVLSLLTLMTMMVCNVNAQSVFYEDFDNGSSEGSLPAGWTTYSDTLTNYGTYSQYNQSWQVWYPSGSNRSGEAMSVTFTTDTWEPCNRWLITPRIAFPADSVMSLLFWQYGGGLCQFHVRVSTTGTEPADFTAQIGHLTTQSYKQRTCLSLASFAGDSIYIAFVNDVVHANGHCSQYIALDDIEVKCLPENSIALTDVLLPEQTVVGQSVTATLKVTNYGGNHVGSLNYSYTIGDNSSSAHTASVNLWPYGTASVPVTFVPTELGENTIRFQVGMPNGTDDYDTTDNSIVRILMVTEESPVSIPVVENQTQFFVYPNPMQGKVMIKTGEEASEAWLIDMSGHREEVHLVSQGDCTYLLDLTAFPRGVYVLALTTADGCGHSVRLLKQSDIVGNPQF